MSNCTAAMILSSFSIILTKQWTLSITRHAFDSSQALYYMYKWSIVTMRLSCTVMEICRLKYWTHGRGHEKIDGRRETERGRGRGRKGKRKVEREKEEKGGGEKKWEVKERGREMEGKGKGAKEGKEEGKEKRRRRKGKGKRKEKGMEKGKGKGKENGEGEREENGKGKRRWKEDSLRNVGSTDTRTLRWFYTLSNAMHCIGQTINWTPTYFKSLLFSPFKWLLAIFKIRNQCVGAVRCNW